MITSALNLSAVYVNNWARRRLRLKLVQKQPKPP